MKTYYDLTSKEKGNYIDEFKKTPGGKSLFETRAVLIILTAIIFVGVIILSIYTEETSSMMDKLELIEKYATFMLVFTIAYSTYFNINFTSWLKNKHEIKRW